ncbi:MAG: cytochrome c oxidase subunit 3 [Pyrinomonadaceae bacterium]
MNTEIGIAEPIKEGKKNRPASSTFRTGKGAKGGRSSGGGGNDGGNNGGNDGGDNKFSNNQDFEQTEKQFHPDRFRIVMWFLLLVVVMTFGGLISTYIVIATNGVAEWKPFNLPFQIWISTALILASSISYQISNKKINQNNQQAAKNWLLVTTVLGAAFISSQIVLWFAMVKRGVYVQGNPYAGLFYILTAIHAIHVSVGIGGLGYVLLRIWNYSESETELLRRQTISKVIGWYWHFMDGLWIVLILLLGFWK